METKKMKEEFKKVLLDYKNSRIYRRKLENEKCAWTKIMKIRGEKR